MDTRNVAGRGLHGSSPLPILFILPIKIDTYQPVSLLFHTLYGQYFNLGFDVLIYGNF